MNLPQADHRKSDKWIPYYFIPFFAVIVLVNAVFIYMALHTYTGVVSDQSYESGLAYNQTLAEADKESQMKIRQEVVYANGTLKWTLHHLDGKPIEKAVVKVHFIRAVQSGHDFDHNLTEHGNGLYMAEVPLPMTGAWTAKLEATWGKAQHYTTTYRFVSP